MLRLLLLPATAFLVGWLGTLLVLRMAPRWRLLQLPNTRSSHAHPTAGGGGIGIVLGTLVAASWLAWESSSGVLALLVISLPLAIVGLLDDMLGVPASVRLAVQTAVVAGLLALLGTAAPLHGLIIALVLLAGLWWINLFNFMDGIDGIAGTQAVFMLLAGAALAAWGAPHSVGTPYWMLTLCIAAATLGFLALNWPPARIFMGDVGSTWLACMILVAALYSVLQGWLAPVVWLVLGAAFIVDASVTLAVRVLRGERWYQAHRSHAYQHLAKRWDGNRRRGHRSVTLLAAAIDMLWLLPLAAACIRLPQWTWLWLCLAYLPLVVAVYRAGAGRADPTAG